MKLKVEYSTIVRDKMKDLKQYLTESFGNKVAVNVLKKITFALRSLSDFPEKGVSVSELFGVDTDFRCLYVKQNQFFYYIDEKKIIVAEMFNEREDFMYKLFGVKSNTEDSDEYWDE